MSTSYSISNTVNFMPVGIGFTDPNIAFPAIYGNTDYGFTVSFSMSDADIISIISASSNLSDVSILSSNSIRVERNQNANLFPGELFDFVRFEEGSTPFKTIETYEPQDTDQADSETSVFKWTTPPIKLVTATYSITFGILLQGQSTPTTRVVSYTQELRWFWTPGLQQLDELVNRSRL